MRAKLKILGIFSVLVLILFSSCTLDTPGAKRPSESEMRLVESAMNISQLLCRNARESLAANFDPERIVVCEEDANGSVDVYLDNVNIEEFVSFIDEGSENDFIIDEAKSILGNSLISGTYQRKNYIDGLSAKVKTSHTAFFTFSGISDIKSVEFFIIDDTIHTFAVNDYHYDMRFYNSVVL